MGNEALYPDTEAYVNLFYEPSISAYRFLKAFFAELYQKGVREVSRDLVSFFIDIKKEPEYQEILHEIKFRSNGIFYYSNELEDTIFTLQNMGLLGKENPSFGIILIKYNDTVSQETLADIPEEYMSLIENISDRYIEYTAS